jgi:hypothetical protein
VVDLRTLAPLDIDTVAASVEKTGRALIVCEDCKTGGVSAEIMARVVEECFDFCRRNRAALPEPMHPCPALILSKKPPCQMRRTLCRPRPNFSASTRKLSMAKRKESPTTSVVAAMEPVPVTRTDFLLALLLGAVAAVLALMLQNFGARQLWSPFGQQNIGGALFRNLIISGLVSGVVSTLSLRGLWQPPLRMVPPAACALGWGVFGLLQHTTQSGTFLQFFATNGAP